MRTLPLFLLLLAGGTVYPVHAGPDVSLTPLVSGYNHWETNASGRELNREEGYLQGINLTVAHPISEAWHWRASGQRLSGTVDYRGETQSGTELNSRTHHRHQQLGLQLGRCFAGCRTRVNGELVYARQRRAIQSGLNSLALTERYAFWELKIAVQQQLVPDYLWLNAGLVRTFEGRVTPDLGELGYGQPSIALPEGWGAETGVRLRVIEVGSVVGDLLLVYRYRETPRSQSVRATHQTGTVLLINQPETHVQQWQFGLSVYWR